MTAEQTEGGFFVMQVDVAPGGGPPPLHTHDAAELFWTLREVVAPLRAQQPEARVAVRELPTPEQVAALNDGSLDLGLVREPVDDPGLSRRCLLVELLGVSVPVDHPLAARERVSLRDLEGESFICFPRQHANAVG